MKRPEDVAKDLAQVRAELTSAGHNELAQKIERSIDDLRNRLVVPVPLGGVMTTGEAAAALGIRSVNTIKRWAADGLLEGFRRGGRILVSCESVEKLKTRSMVSAQRDWESGLDEALTPFDADDEQLPPSAAMTHGRRPWETDGTAETVDSAAAGR